MKLFDDATYFELMITLPKTLYHWGEDVSQFELAGYLELQTEQDPSPLFENFVLGTYNGKNYLLVFKFIGENHHGSRYFLAYDDYLHKIEEEAVYYYVGPPMQNVRRPIAIFDDAGKLMDSIQHTDDPEVSEWIKVVKQKSLQNRQEK